MPEAANPYQAPESLALPPELSREPSPLKDPRFFAWMEYLCWLPFSMVLVVALLQPVDGSWTEALGQITSCSLLGIVLFHSLWIYRCASNAAIIDPDTAPGPLWAVLCHIVPVAQFFMPCVVMRQIAKATFKFRPTKGLDTFILVWWVMVFGMALLTRSNDTDILNLLWRLLTLLVAAATIYMIHRITRGQVDFRWTDAPENERPVSPAPQILQPAGYPPMRRNVPPTALPASKSPAPPDPEPS